SWRSAGYARAARRSYGGPIVLPAPAPRRQHEVWILRLSQRTVVAAERAVIVAALHVQIEAQDGAAVGEVGAQVKEIVARLADQLQPDRHHLHVAARAGARDCIFAEAALDLDD